MKLTANYLELSSIIFDKTEKQVEFEYGGNADSVIVKYMNIPCLLRIEQIDSNSVILSYQIGGDSSDIMVSGPSPLSFIGGLFKRGAQKIGNKAAEIVIENFVKHPAVSIIADRTLCVDLRKIPQLDDVRKVADIEDVSFNEAGAALGFILKTSRQI
ncbi:MAG: hypothetical protein MJY48_01025 [Bacteroidales bacterium]|nr:hypothetical protein [Bacteroidales bacterium]